MKQGRELRTLLNEHYEELYRQMDEYDIMNLPWSIWACDYAEMFDKLDKK